MKKEIVVLRELARKVSEIGTSERQNENRKNWRDHNSLGRTPPLIHVRPFLSAAEIVPDSALQCESAFCRDMERSLRMTVFQDTLGDDTVLEPWLAIPAEHTTTAENRWGFPLVLANELDLTKFNFQPPIGKLKDFAKIKRPHYELDVEKTQARFAQACEAVGDIIDIAVDAQPLLHYVAGDISSDIGLMVGMSNLMYFVYDEPELLHKMAKLMRECILEQYKQAEAIGNMRMCSSFNQCVPYARELPDPNGKNTPVKLKDLWGFMSAQEFGSVSPAMYREFLLEYQMPIMELFGLVAYGCCEDVTPKLDLVKTIPNLRRIAVHSWSNVEKCAEEIGRDFVISYRPNPSQSFCNGYSEEAMRACMEKDVAELLRRDSIFDVTLKDVRTVNGNPAQLADWVRDARGLIEK